MILNKNTVFLSVAQVFIVIEFKKNMKEFIIRELRKSLIKEGLIKEELRFNDGRLNKTGPNVIYMNDEPIVDFGIGQIGNVSVAGSTIENGLFLQGGYNTAIQGAGYGTMGLKFIFNKLPKIENIVVQCYDTACPFWYKMGGEVIDSKDIAKSGKPLRTVVISKDNFMSKVN